MRYVGDPLKPPRSAFDGIFQLKVADVDPPTAVTPTGARGSPYGVALTAVDESEAPIALFA